MMDELPEGRVLLVDDQRDRADELVAALAPSPFDFDVTGEVPDLEAALGSGQSLGLCTVSRRPQPRILGLRAAGHAEF